MSGALYLPFRDRELGYDCANCRASCCNAGYLGVTNEELVQIAPKARAFHYGKRGKLEMYRKFKPTCWFLDDDNWCTIEKERGYDHKPYVCRAHPIYFRHFPDEDVTISHFYRGCVWVSNPGLEGAIGALGHEGARSLHAEWSQLEPQTDTLDAALWSGLELKKVIGLEEEIRDLCADFDEVGPALEKCAERTAAFLDVAPLSAGWFEPLLARIAEQLETEPLPEGSAAHQRAFLRSVPMLRLLLLPGVVEAKPLLPVDARAALAAAPRLLAAVYALSVEYTQVSAKRSTPDHNTFAEMIELWAPRFLGMSMVDTVVEINDEVELEIEAEDPEFAEAFLVEVSEAEAGARVGEVLNEVSERGVELRLERFEELARLARFLREVPSSG